MSTVTATRSQSGFSLIVVVTVIGLLTLLGLMVMDTVHVDTQLAGGDRAAQNALYVAEAAAMWGKDELESTIYVAGDDTPHIDNVDTAFPVITAPTDAICPDSALVPCAYWHQMDGGVPIDYEDTNGVKHGTYRVAVRCDAATCAGRSSDTLYLRALGTMTDGSQKMVEIVIGRRND